MTLYKPLSLIMLFSAPLLCAAETWNNVSLVDVNCSAKAKNNPDGHTRKCAL